ncbi:hypothetical protein P261_02861 [Lachnospiraceae bacterium TWA4]|nr:hypothetical protein P261_02861 [Lachnospiraceae bacterium TWA4]
MIIGYVSSLFNENFVEWKSLYQMKQYTELFNEPIIKMMMRETVDYPECVVFNDSDLIKEWMDFLKTVEVKEKKKFCNLKMEVEVSQ